MNERMMWEVPKLVLLGSAKMSNGEIETEHTNACHTGSAAAGKCKVGYAPNS